MERFICLLIGYAFGLIQTGYIYGKMKGVDIRKEGSGNAGSTNALRTMGIKAGLVTLLGDCFKCVFAVVTVYLIYGKTYADIFPLLAMYAGMGAVLGHNYPFYLNFKGGKGIAATAGLILSTTNVWMVLFICISRNRGSDTLCVSWLPGSCDHLSDRSGCVWPDGRIWCKTAVSL